MPLKSVNYLNLNLTYHKAQKAFTFFSFQMRWKNMLSAQGRWHFQIRAFSPHTKLTVYLFPTTYDSFTLSINVQGDVLQLCSLDAWSVHFVFTRASFSFAGRTGITTGVPLFGSFRNVTTGVNKGAVIKFRHNVLQFFSIVMFVPNHSIETERSNESQTQQPKHHIKNLCFREEVLPEFNTCQGLQKSNGPKYPTLSSNSFALGVCEICIILPHCGGSNDSNEEDPTPAERMWGLEDKDVLQEKRV